MTGKYINDWSARPPASPPEQTGDWLIAANLASLNEIVTELTSVASRDPEFRDLVRNLLRDHSWSLGVAFQGMHGDQQEAGRRLARQVEET